MTFAVLRALHAILADAIDDIERIYSPAKVSPDHCPSVEDDKTSYASPPPSPSLPLDFPSLDAPYDPNDPAEQLTTHPVVVQAINRIVAAAGQMASAVQAPFYSLCDATMGYHLPSCMRLLEASHTVEILREAGPSGLHVDLISQRNGVDSTHILRLLATHHFIREKSPNVFTINRISSLMDTGKSFEELKQCEREGRLEMKYQNTNGIAAFVGMCSDELFKSSAYLTEAYLQRAHPSRPPFGYAFDTDMGFFPWLEGEGGDSGRPGMVNKDKLRVERFGKAMSGTGSWEAPGAVFDDALARTILLRLREAATPETKLVLAEFVLPLACVDVDVTDDSLGHGILDEVEGAESMLAPAPLLANLDASDVRCTGTDLEGDDLSRFVGRMEGSGSAFLDVPSAKGTQAGDISGGRSKQEITDMERSRSRCGTPTFGSRTDLPSMQEAMARFGGGIARSRVPGPIARYRPAPLQPGISRPPMVNTSSVGLHLPVKKKPSPLALSSPKASPLLVSPCLSSPPPTMKRHVSLAQLRCPSQQQGLGSPLPILPPDGQPPSPMSPRHPHFPQHTSSPRKSNVQVKHSPTRSLTVVNLPPPSSPPSHSTSASPPPRPRSLSRPKSLAHLHQTAQNHNSSPVLKSRSPVPPLPSLRPGLSPSASSSLQSPVRVPPPRLGPIPRRASHAPAPQASSLRKRSGTIIGPPTGVAGIGGSVSMTDLLKADTVRGSGGGSLNFGATYTKEEPQPEPTQGKMNVLAAAARIERGVPSRPTSP
ncbi:hypothetical protein C0993_000845 [Termitomyces sp. T159_Od127]|nr:hypothetical protein C0993_000845 [Termitomyces sp. T159_Od127]